MSDTEEIRKRHERQQQIYDEGKAHNAKTPGYGPVMAETSQDHEDRGVLLEYIAELEYQLAGCTCPTVAQLRRQGGE